MPKQTDQENENIKQSVATTIKVFQPSDMRNFPYNKAKGDMIYYPSGE